MKARSTTIETREKLIMSYGEVIIGAIGTAAGVVGTAVVGTVGAVEVAGVAAVATGVAVAVGAAGTVLAVGVGTLATIGHGIYKAGQNAAEVIKIEQENRKQLKKATENYLESLKAEEGKCEEFIDKILNYFSVNGLLFEREEVNSILGKEKSIKKKIDIATSFIEVESDYEVARSNLLAANKIATTFGIDNSKLISEFDSLIGYKNNLSKLKEAINSINSKIIEWIKEQETKLQGSKAYKVAPKEMWNIVTEERNVIAIICKDDFVKYFETTHDKEIVEAKVKIENNQKRMIIINMYKAISDLQGFPLFEEETNGVLSSVLALFQDEQSGFTDSEISRLLDTAIDNMNSIYNRLSSKIGKETLQYKINFYQASSINKELRSLLGLPEKTFEFNINFMKKSLEEVSEDNERLKKMYEQTEINKIWVNKLTQRFKSSGYEHVSSARTVQVLKNVIKTCEYFITPDKECCVIVATYSDGRPSQVLVEGIALDKYHLQEDKTHILSVQHKYCGDTEKIFEGLYEQEIIRHKPTLSTATAVELPSLPEEYKRKAVKARKERTSKKGETKHLHKDDK